VLVNVYGIKVSHDAFQLTSWINRSLYLLIIILILSCYLFGNEDPLSNDMIKNVLLE